MRYIITCALLAILIGAHCGLAGENSSNEASGFAEGGAALLAAGKTEKAQTLFYKALVYDSHCAVALYELGKLFDAEGNAVSAADFLARASLELAKGKAAHPNYAAKYQDATQRLQKLNPYAIKYNQLVEEYALDLCKITKKCPDSLTGEEVCNRIDALGLATLLPKDKLPIVNRLALDLGSGVRMELVLIPAGKFTMGNPDKQTFENEHPTHVVTLTMPFYMGKYAVTQEQYEAIMGNNPSRFKGAQNPVEMVLWDEAQAFCQKLSKKSGKTVRLPTEAEWEYACRAGTSTKYYSGDSEEDLKRVAWFRANSNGTTHPVGQKEPNKFGLFDMHGNVLQWCMDWSGDYHANEVADPQGPAQGASRVLRGGSWCNFPVDCKSASRHGSFPVFRIDQFGFRVVMAPASSTP